MEQQFYRFKHDVDQTRIRNTWIRYELKTLNQKFAGWIWSTHNGKNSKDLKKNKLSHETSARLCPTYIYRVSKISSHWRSHREWPNPSHNQAHVFSTIFPNKQETFLIWILNNLQYVMERLWLFQILKQAKKLFYSEDKLRPFAQDFSFSKNSYFIFYASKPFFFLHEYSYLFCLFLTVCGMRTRDYMYFFLVLCNSLLKS